MRLVWSVALMFVFVGVVYLCGVVKGMVRLIALMCFIAMVTVGILNKRTSSGPVSAISSDESLNSDVGQALTNTHTMIIGKIYTAR